MTTSEQSGRRTARRPAFSLLELVVVIFLLALLSALVVPRLSGQIEANKMPYSAEQLRALLRMTRAHAMADGLRYQIRFLLPAEVEEREAYDEWHAFQPVVEYEPDPLGAPGRFEPVTAEWAIADTFYEPVRCARVRLGLYDVLDDEEFDEEFGLEARDLDEDELLAPLVFEPDGSSERATFVLTRQPFDVTYDELRDLQEEDLTAVLEVHLDGRTGDIWLLRPWVEEEKDLFRQLRVRPDFRRDFTSTDRIGVKTLEAATDEEAENALAKGWVLY